MVIILPFGMGIKFSIDNFIIANHRCLCLQISYCCCVSIKHWINELPKFENRKLFIVLVSSRHFLSSTTAKGKTTSNEWGKKTDEIFTNLPCIV
jgi:hypothetical protein